MDKQRFFFLFSLFWLITGLVVLLALVAQPQLWQKQAATTPRTFASLLQPTLTPGVDYAPSQVIVKFKSGVQAAGLQALSTDPEVLSVEAIGKIDGGSVLLNLATGVDPVIKAASLGMDVTVEFAEPNYNYTPLLVPNDTRFPEQWSLGKIEAPLAWDLSTGSSAVTIAVLDTGIDRTHPDLAGRVIGDTTIVSDHGTKVAGVIGSLTNNNTGIAALGFSNLTLDAHTVCTGPATCYAADIAQGIDRAVAKNERIILMAFGGPANSNLVQDAVSSAAFLGHLIIAAAGNSGTTDLTYPAAYPQVMSVAGTDPFDARSPFSQFGTWVDVAAPGSGVLTTDQSGGFSLLTGTSMAAAQAASLAGLLLSIDSSLSGPILRNIIQATTDPVSFTLKYGRINAQKALAKIVSVPTPTLTPTPPPAVTPTPTVSASPGPSATPYPPPKEPTFVTATECQGINPLMDPYCALLEIPKLFYIVVQFLQYAAALLFIIFLIWGGFLWLTAGDDPRKLHRAHLTLFWALTGLVIAFSLRVFAGILATFAQP